jgi:hypothetical protein
MREWAFTGRKEVVQSWFLLDSLRNLRFWLLCP